MKDRLRATVECRIKRCFACLAAVALMGLTGCGSEEPEPWDLAVRVGSLGGKVWQVPLDNRGDGKVCELLGFVLPRIPVNETNAVDYADLIYNKRKSLDQSLGEIGLSLGDRMVIFLSREAKPQGGMGYDFMEVDYPYLRYLILVEGERRVFVYAFTLRQGNCAGQMGRVRDFFIRRVGELEEMDEKSRRGMRDEEINSPTPQPGDSLPGEELRQDEKEALDRGALLLGWIKWPVSYVRFDMSAWATGGVKGCEIYSRVLGRRMAPQGAMVEVYNHEKNAYEKRVCVSSSEKNTFEWK